MFEREPGLFFPFLGRRRIPCNRDGSIVDTGEQDMLDEISAFYLEVWAFEWLGFGLPIWPWSLVYDAATGKPLS